MLAYCHITLQHPFPYDQRGLVTTLMGEQLEIPVKLECAVGGMNKLLVTGNRNAEFEFLVEYVILNCEKCKNNHLLVPPQKSLGSFNMLSLYKSQNKLTT